MKNGPYSPSVTIEGPSRSIVISFSWGVVAKLQQELGNLECYRVLATTLQSRDVAGIAKIIAAASEGETVESVMAASLPINPAIDAVQDAWLIFLWGRDKKPPAMAGEAKSDPLPAPSTSFGSLLKHFLGRVAAGPNSGTEPPSKLN